MNSMRCGRIYIVSSLSQDGNHMFGRVAKWGNSLALRIPSPFARELDVEAGRTVEVTITGGRLVVTPVGDGPAFDLADLLAAVTEGNVHDEVNTGAAVGNEAV